MAVEGWTMTLAGMNVLLAEDNPTNQMVAIQMLEALGARVTLAEDGAEALAIAERESFDLMLVDIEMPRVSGIDVIRQVRAAPPPRCQTPIIALTAYVMREHREPISAAGADGIIPKPIVSIEQLGRDILGMVRRRRSQDPSAPGEPAPATPGAAPEGPVIDRTIYDSLAEAIGPQAMSELLLRVAEDLADAGARIRRGISEGDAPEVRAATHILISVAGAIGAVGLQHAAQALNSASHRGDGEALRRDGPALGVLLDRVREAVGSLSRG